MKNKKRGAHFGTTPKGFASLQTCADCGQSLIRRNGKLHHYLGSIEEKIEAVKLAIEQGGAFNLHTSKGHYAIRGAALQELLDILRTKKIWADSQIEEP